MKSLNSWKLLVVVFGIYFLLEYLMNYFSDDAVPLWKMIAVGVIAGLASFSFLMRRGKRYPLSTLLSYKKRVFPILKDQEQTLQQIAVYLKDSAYVGIKQGADKPSIRFYTKRNKLDPGLRFSIQIRAGELVVKAGPRFFIQLIDEGGRIEAQMQTLVQQLVELEWITLSPKE